MYARSIRAAVLVWAAATWLNAQSSTGTRFIEDTLRPYYEHTGFTWKIERIPHFELNFEINSEAERRLPQLGRVAAESREAVLQLLGADKYDPVIHIFFVGSIQRMNELIGAQVLGRSRPTQHAMFCVVARFAELSLAHEMAHEIATNILGPAEPWLEEGFANYVVDNNSSRMNLECLVMLQSKQWIPLKNLVNPDWRSSVYSPDDEYPELGGFVQFLYETYGIERFQRIWHDGSRNITKVYGRKLSELEKEYRASLAKFRDVHHYQITLPGADELFLQKEVPDEHRVNAR
jgi:hypothetical protein